MVCIPDEREDVSMKTSVAILSVLLAATALGSIAMETASKPAHAAAAVTPAKKPIFGNWGVDLPQHGAIDAGSSHLKRCGP